MFQVGRGSFAAKSSVSLSSLLSFDQRKAQPSYGKSQGLCLLLGSQALSLSVALPTRGLPSCIESRLTNSKPLQ